MADMTSDWAPVYPAQDRRAGKGRRLLDNNRASIEEIEGASWPLIDYRSPMMNKLTLPALLLTMAVSLPAKADEATKMRESLEAAIERDADQVARVLGAWAQEARP